MRKRLISMLVVLLAPYAGAQSIHGTVRDSASRLPVPGTIVIVLDSARLVLARAVTNARGEYDLQRAPQARTLRTMRLGFRPVELPISASASPIVQLDVSIRAVPVTLDAVRTLAAAHCPKRDDAQQAFSLLEQVRTGLLATIVARETKPAILTKLAVVRTRRFDTDSVTAMTVIMDSAMATNTYAASLSAADFIETGFAHDSAGALTTYGPDAEVLMDAAFTNGYCFRLMDQNKSRPRQVGLGFAAGSTQRGRIDIDGALWVDTSAKALVDIEFLYRGFDKALDPAHPGGHIEFRTMPNGVTIIDRWFLRIPSEVSRNKGAPPPQRTGKLWMANVVVKEIGGELARANWEDGTTWHASLGTVQLHLVNSKGNADAGRKVRLDSTSYVATSDASGTVTIRDLAPGPYNVILADEQLKQLGVSIPTPVQFIAKRDSTLLFTVPTITAEELVQASCKADRTPLGAAMLFGRVLEPGGDPADDVDITIDRLASGRGTERVVERMRTGSNGLFRWCAFEERWSIIITARRGDLKRTIEVPTLDAGLTVTQFKLRAGP